METVTGRAKVYNNKTKNHNTINVYTNIDFFSTEVILTVHEDCIVFTKPTIDYRGETRSLHKIGNGYSTSVPNKMPVNEYEFDEDSTEDEIIIYY